MVEESSTAENRVGRARLFTAAIFLVTELVLLVVLPFGVSASGPQDIMDVAVWVLLMVVWAAVLLQNIRKGENHQALLAAGAVLTFGAIAARNSANFVTPSSFTLLKALIIVLLVAAAAFSTFSIIVQVRHKGPAA